MNKDEKRIEKIIKANRKIFRKLEYIWNILTNPKNYLIPETIEEYRAFFYTPKIQINNHEYYFNKTAEERLNEFVDTFQEIEEIERFTSYGYIKSTVIKSIEKAVEKRVKNNSKPNVNQIADIIATLIASQKKYLFIRSIEGLELEGIKSIELGDSEIFVFDSNYQEKIKQHCEKSDSLEFYEKNVVPMINKYFLNKVCLRVEAFGESKKAGDIALKRMRLIINVLRFFLCLSIYKRVHQYMIQISLSNEAYKCGDESICIGLESDDINLISGQGRMPLQKYSITSGFIEKLKKNCFFDEIINLITKEHISELEGSILTAIYWIGEAQNEFDYDVAFLKYWTALEAVTFNPTDISEALSISIAILLVFGGYDFIKIQDIEETKKLLKKLYDKRSAVIHRGMREIVSPLDVTEICKFSTWTALSLLNLRQKNYTELADIKKEVDRLYSLSSKSV